MRFILSHDDEWQLADASQDIRGWPVRDRAGLELGSVRSLVADTDSELVEAIVLNNGTEIPAREIDLGTGVVYVRGTTVDPTVGRGAVPTNTPYRGVRIRR